MTDLFDRIAAKAGGAGRAQMLAPIITPQYVPFGEDTAGLSPPLALAPTDTVPQLRPDLIAMPLPSAPKTERLPPAALPLPNAASAQTQQIQINSVSGPARATMYQAPSISDGPLGKPSSVPQATFLTPVRNAPVPPVLPTARQAINPKIATSAAPSSVMPNPVNPVANMPVRTALLLPVLPPAAPVSMNARAERETPIAQAAQPSVRVSIGQIHITAPAPQAPVFAPAVASAPSVPAGQALKTYLGWRS